MTREELRDYVEEQRSLGVIPYHVYSTLIDGIDTLEQEPKTENKGEWKMPIQDDGMSDPIYYQVRCSKCGFDLDPQTWHQELHQYGADNFCPNCGADMRGKQNETDN